MELPKFLYMAGRNENNLDNDLVLSTSLSLAVLYNVAIALLSIIF
jgi:hypothetical protein